MSELLPCPFCGSDCVSVAVYGGRAAFGCWESASAEFACYDCGAEISIPVNITAAEENMDDFLIRQLTYERAVEAWNTRNERTCHVTRSELVDKKEGIWLVDLSCGHGDACVFDKPYYCSCCGAKVIDE